MFPELLADLIDAISDDLGDDEISQMAEAAGERTARETILEHWLRQNGIASFFDKHEFIKKWVYKAHIGEVRELSMRAIDAQLKKFGVSPGERKKARFNLQATQNNVWWRKRNTTSPYAWRYLIDEKHSDRCIYRMRIHWKNKDHTSNIDIVFLHKVRMKEKPFNTSKPQKIKAGMKPGDPIPSPAYLYHQIPNAIIAVMSLMPLTYLTKNNYFAGAWNFFWYAWLVPKGLTGNKRGTLKGFRFMKQKAHKGIIKYMNKILKGEA